MTAVVINSSIADTTKLTTVLWFYIASADVPDPFNTYLLEFGQVPEQATTDNCVLRIGYAANGGLGGPAGINTTINIDTVGRFKGDTGDYAAGEPIINIGVLNWDPANIGGGGATPFFTLDSWNVLVAAVDFSIANTQPEGMAGAWVQRTKCAILANGVNLTTKTLPGSGSTAFSSGPGPNWGINDNAYIYVGPPAIVTPPVWPMPVSDTQIGIPVNQNDVGFHNLRPLRLANYQVWFGTYIEPTPFNIGKFIRPSGQLVRPDVAAAAFGLPDFAFDGNSQYFPLNQGTAGAMTLSGSLTNVEYPTGLIGPVA